MVVLRLLWRPLPVLLSLGRVDLTLCALGNPLDLQAKSKAQDAQKCHSPASWLS